jgi:hypothetical protein
LLLFDALIYGLALACGEDTSLRLEVRPPTRGGSGKYHLVEWSHMLSGQIIFQAVGVRIGHKRGWETCMWERLIESDVKIGLWGGARIDLHLD